MLIEHAQPQPPDAPSFPQRLTSYSVNIFFTSVAIVAAFALVLRAQQPRLCSRALESHKSEACHFGVQPYQFVGAGGKLYNETPHEWSLLPYDAACEPRDLAAPLLNASRSAGPRDDKLAIMLFGDRCGRQLQGAPLLWHCSTCQQQVRIDPCCSGCR